MLVLGTGALAACGEDDGAEKALQGVRLGAGRTASWADASWPTPTAARSAGDAAQTELTKLEGDLAARRPKVTDQGQARGQEDRGAGATVTVAWPVTDAATWNYDTTVRLVKRDDDWLPVFAPQTIVPDLPTGAGLKATVDAGRARRGSSTAPASRS